ncbi:exosome nuclease subunit [Coemansia brasiliensis]|uniref:Exosome nuclease subunit n=1 Tax=Coemansia brasiliensis TaxID=2650707 RepID=A0A9W8IAD4_9FUNG|nr:exosome nuclease subunit [Coemansia brasiliensis]
MDEFVGNFDSSLAAAFGALVGATKVAGKLPSDIAFHRALDESVDQRLAQTSERVLGMGNALWTRAQPGAAQVPIDSIDDVALRQADGRWQLAPGFRPVVDAIDTLLEKIDVGLDEVLKTAAHQMRAQASGQMGGQSAPLVTTVKTSSRADYRLVHAQNIPRPQLSFKDAVDNSPSTPFVWKIRKKVHAKVPLDYGLPSAALADSPLGHHLHSLGIARPGSTPPSSGHSTPRAPRSADVSQGIAAMSALEAGSLGALPHPYEYEITHIEYPPWVFEAAPPQPPAEWDAAPFAFVDTAEQLHAMMGHLLEARELAIDLEHHDYRSYQGFTCLVQLSTRTRDYVVDALALRAELAVLNEVTADPAKIKVFHGAESDIVWLQRDFGVYVVGLFDTYHASHVLNMPHHSLAHLLQTYCAYRADKKYQLADWRIRPVPPEMLAYARADTHFLLHVFDRMRGELLERGRRLVGKDVATPGQEHFGLLAGLDRVASPTQPLELVLRRSEQTSLKKHVKEGYDAEHGLGLGGWARLLKKWCHPFTPTQLAVFRALHQWRDSCARQEDESVRYVLPNHMLFAIADRMPTEPPQLLALCQPTPPLVRLYASDVVLLIKRERQRADARLQEFGALVQAEEAPRAAPVHTRFAEEQPARAAARAEDVLSEQLLRAADAMVAAESRLFGGLPTRPPRPTAASQKAQAIRSSLALSVAVPARVVAGASQEEPELARVRAKRPREPAEPPKDMMVISEAFQPPRQQAAARPPPPKKSKTAEALDLSKIALSDDAMSDENVPQKKKRSRKRGRMPAPKEKAEKVERFDYRAEDADAIGESAGGVKQARKKKTFDPYAKVDDSKFAKKPNRSRVNNKSGNRTLSYKK